jgi:probable phosphoglycerate mutase
MTRLLLIRHAATHALGRRITGRAEEALNAAGRQQAEQLARVAPERAPVIYTSPRGRARQTAEILGRVWGANVREAGDIDEIDYGDWTGRTLDELRLSAHWRAFNAARSCTPIPNGESIPAVQERTIGFFQSLRERHSYETVAAVTHAEVIRAALIYYLGIPVDLMLRLEISPASMSIVQLDEGGATLFCANWTQGPLR